MKLFNSIDYEKDTKLKQIRCYNVHLFIDDNQ